MKVRRRRERSGESIVEVMVSAVIFLMLMSVLQGAVMFSSSAQKKSQEIRQDTAKICEGLQLATASGNVIESYKFYATSTDGSVVGNQVFSISALKQKKTVSYTDSDGNASEVTFYLYGGITP